MENEVDDFFTDDLLKDRKKRKKRKADGKKKGNRTELELVKVFNKRFGGGFSTVGRVRQPLGPGGALAEARPGGLFRRPDRAPGIQVGTRE